MSTTTTITRLKNRIEESERERDPSTVMAYMKRYASK